MRRILVLVLAVLMLAACSKQAPEVTANDQVPADQRTEAGSSEGASEAGGGSSPTWVAIDIDFESAPETLPAGETEIELINNGQTVHDVSFDEPDETVVTANAGETKTGTVNLEAGTTYTYYCSVPGHREAGMEGELKVE